MVNWTALYQLKRDEYRQLAHEYEVLGNPEQAEQCDALADHYEQLLRDCEELEAREAVTVA